MSAPEGVRCNWNLTQCSPEQIQKDTLTLIADLQKLADQSGTVPLDQATYDTVVKVSPSLH